MLRRGAVAVAIPVLAALVLAAGCAGRPGADAGTPPPTTTSASPPPASVTPPASPGATDDPIPTMGPPSGPPKSPSDPEPASVLVGRIVTGGNGPCYRLETDDGVIYAVHSGTAGTLASGTTVRVYTAPARRALACGPGRPVDAERIEVVR
jgi:hypothetical protein